MLQTYYRNPHVRKRILAYLGGLSPETVSTVYVTTGQWLPPQQRSPLRLDNCFAQKLEIFRSLWDHEALLVHLDLEYVNFDFPEEAYVSPARMLQLQQPVVSAVETLLQRYGIPFLKLLSGRGYHYVWKVCFGTEAFQHLSQLGHVPAALRAAYSSQLGPQAELVTPALASAFAGLGCVMEYLGHQAREMAAPMSSLPIQLTAVEAGPGKQPNSRGREVVSIDLSEYGDPLYIRTLRVPFSAYLKPEYQRHLLGSECVDQLPPMFLIPLSEMSPEEGIVVMRDQEKVEALAATCDTWIPDASQPMMGLVRDYEADTLAQCHRWFYEEEQEPPESWPDTYDQTDLTPFPPCVQKMLTHPNDLLLKPACLQSVVRILLSLQWHPRHIAGLIRSKYERNFDWGPLWHEYSAVSRADFYTRLFAGLCMTGRDSLVDLNCQSQREKGYCLVTQCSANLAQFQKALKERRL